MARENACPFFVHFPPDSPNGDIAGRIAFPEDAAALVSVLGSGASIQFRYRGLRYILWTEGEDGEAGESYDHAAGVCMSRLTDNSIPYW